MSLDSGTLIGSFEITGKLGAGGMGEVYRARDTRLGRDVALKILPNSVTADDDYRTRFSREAQLLAALNHPNIAQIYGVEENAIVMELVEGQNLSGPLALNEALLIARQIAEALEAAHEKGIIHRDLKPQNIKVTPGGTVKVLDFGLAKTEIVAAASALTSPTMTIASTRVGTIMGTAAYMSPEQAAGKPVDKRCDIWSFGVVVWEMLTGRQLFEGETVSHVLAAVLRADIDLTQLPASTPARVRDLLARCLERDPKVRLRDIGEARILIGSYLSNPSAAVGTEPRRQGNVRVAWAAALLFFLVAAAAAWLAWRERQQPRPVTHATTFVVTPPEREHFHAGMLSPDGKRIAFEIDRGGGAETTYLAVRAIDSLDIQPLPGTDGARGPFWSPDGRALAFLVPGKLKKIGLDGSASVVISDVPAETATQIRGAWNQDGTILIAGRQGLFRVSSSGGILTPLPSPSGEGRSDPQFLPGGQRYLYVAHPKDSPPSIRVGSLATEKSEHVVDNASFAVFAGSGAGANEGRLLFMRDTTLFAQPFDARQARVSGEAAVVADRVGLAYGAPGPSVSDTGALAYQSSMQDQVRIVSVAPHETPVDIAPAAAYQDLSVSPDGKSAAVTVQTATGSDIWIIDLERKIRSKFTLQPGVNVGPVWSPDGSRIAFSATRNKKTGIYEKPANGTGSEQLLVESQGKLMPNSWSPDGKYLIYTAVTPGTGNDLLILPTFGDRKPRPWLQTEFNESHGQVSPDGRWMAYESNEAFPSYAVYVSTFPDPSGGKWQVSAARSAQPRWSGDGRKLFFLNSGRQILQALQNSKFGFATAAPTVPLTIGSPFAYSAASTLQYAYAPVKGETRFLILRADDPPVTVVQNWWAKR